MLNVEQLLSAYRSGAEVDDIRSTFGVGFGTIYYHLHKHGYALRGMRGPKRHLDDALLCRLYADGGTVRGLAKRFSVCRRTISDHLKRGGVVAQRWQARMPHNNHKPEILRRYREGESCSAIARDYGITHHTIVAIAKAGGEDVRPPAYYLQYPLNETAFDVLTEESEYWMGFLMADGCIRLEKGRYPEIRLNLAIVDIEHVRRFRAFLGAGNPVSVIKRKHPSACFVVRSQRLFDRLGQYGVRPDKSKNGQVHGLEDSRHFWRGVVDGDGTLTWARSYPTMACLGPQGLMNQFADFVERQLGFRLTIGHYRDLPVWTMMASCKKAVAVVRVLYGKCAIALSRKLVRAQNMMDTY